MRFEYRDIQSGAGEKRRRDQSVVARADDDSVHLERHWYDRYDGCDLS